MPPKQGQDSNQAGSQSKRPDKNSKKRPAEGALPAATTKKPKTQGEHPGSKGASVGNTSGKTTSVRDPKQAKPQEHQNGKNSQQTNKFKGSSKPGNDAQPNAKDSKTSKMKDIRRIAAQHSDAALKGGELDVQAFLNARGFEIKALDESMRRTSTSQRTRAFQKVPFVMRRRAAAHNHKRVPKRLHNRASREMKLDNTPTVNSKTRKPGSTRSRLRAETALRLGKLAERKKRQQLLKKGKDGKLDDQTIAIRIARPKIRRNALNKPVITAGKFRKRQLEKTWLPTHLWHAKRARMTEPKEPLWRFAIPLTPTQKFYRPAHRAQWEKGALAWDMSYMSTIGLCGVVKSVEHVLKSLGLTSERLWNEKGGRWRSGAVHWNGSLSRKKGGSVKNIGPAFILWNPEPQPISTESSEGKSDTRRLFIRLHPSTFLETFNELLRLVKGLTPRPYVEDLRYAIGSIDITGPDSTEALLGILKPYHTKPEAQESHATKFESLAGISGPATLPLGSLLAFSIMDPRLRYPPRRVNLPDRLDQASQSLLMQTVSGWHKDEGLKPFALFDRDSRVKASRLPSQKALNRRRGKIAPGAPLEPTKADPEIPVILLATRQSATTGTWTLMVPWNCVLPLWYGLMHYPLSTGGNPGFGGLNEIKQLAFEQAVPWFPGDFPATDAGMVWELEQRLVRKKAWDRMPKGKRVSYETLDLGAGRKGEVGEGWNCDYETLLGLQLSNTEKPDVEMADGENGELAPVEKPDNQDTAPSKHPLANLTHLSRFAFNACLAPKPESLMPASIVTVKITFLSRGVPDPCARVYRLPVIKSVAVSTQAEVTATDPPVIKKDGIPSNLREQWLASIPRKGKIARPKPALKHNSAADIDLVTRRRLLAQELTTPHQTQTNGDGMNGHLLCPDEDDLIGFVTTGSFNLRDGRAQAIGSFSAQKALEDIRSYQNKDDPAARICVVRNAGQNIGWVARWELL
jgi:ribonuclease P/MRP protein subunit POP1